jgi:tetratricopeptide (TPR) repeat protein
VVERILGGWIWLVTWINHTISPVLPPIQPAPWMGRAVGPEVAEAVMARPYEWFRAEEEALTAGVEVAASSGLDCIAVELASALSSTAFDGHLHVLDDPYGPWQRTHDAALDVARRNGNALGTAVLQVGLGRLNYERDEYARSREHLGQALAVFRAKGDVRGEATTLAALGAACREQGRLPEALHFLDQALEMCEELAPLGHIRRLAGSVRLEMGDYPGALADLTAARELFVTAGSPRSEGLALRNLSLYHRARGEWAPAEELARTALTVFERTDDRLMVAYAQRTLAKTLLRLDDPGIARQLAQDAMETCRALDDTFGQACTLRVIGEIHLAQDRAHQARDCLDGALRQWTNLHSEVFRARTQYTLAQAHHALDDTETARRLTTEAIETFRVCGAREYTELTGHWHDVWNPGYRISEVRPATVTHDRQVDP